MKGIKAHICAMGQVICIRGKSKYGPKPKKVRKGQYMCPRPGCKTVLGTEIEIKTKGETK